jgi:uncharacterized protein DUF1153
MRAMEKQGVVIGPRGNVLTRDNLPPPHTGRWVAWRKAEIVTAVRSGLLSLEEACAHYRLSADELQGWSVAYGRHGLNGLKALRLPDRG